jgi:hypothetical protein
LVGVVGKTAKRHLKRIENAIKAATSTCSNLLLRKLQQWVRKADNSIRNGLPVRIL